MRGDHPCVCGEKGYMATFEAGTGGSPLRMRGKGVTISEEAYGLRITPAYAGKSTSLIALTILS